MARLRDAAVAAASATIPHQDFTDQDYQDAERLANAIASVVALDADQVRAQAVTRDLARNLARDRARLLQELRVGSASRVATPQETGPVASLLGCLACVLPASERSRFVAEEMGNLGDCERWRQRASWLTGIAVGMPRLAWIMCHENRPGRA